MGLELRLAHMDGQGAPPYWLDNVILGAVSAGPALNGNPGLYCDPHSPLPSSTLTGRRVVVSVSCLVFWEMGITGQGGRPTGANLWGCLGNNGVSLLYRPYAGHGVIASLPVG